MATHPSATPRPAVPGATRGPATTQRYRRNRRSELIIWWREIDRVLLLLVLILMAIGTAAVAAASPASARRLSTAHVRLDDLHFFILHIRWQVLGLATMIGASMLPKELARRLGIMLGFAMIVALMLVPVIGSEVNGAKRWLNLGVSLQPSEFLKPAFAIGLAWILSWRVRDPNLPVIEISVGLMGLTAALLMLQPDLGSTILFGGVWFVLVLLSGISLKRIGALGALGAGGLVMAYLFYENGRHRIDAFLGGGTAFDQVDLAQRTLLAGGWTGSGLWLGTRKLSLPEAHTDYIFSVIGEEFGLWVCAVIVLVSEARIVGGAAGPRSTVRGRPRSARKKAKAVIGRIAAASPAPPISVAPARRIALTGAILPCTSRGAPGAAKPAALRGIREPARDRNLAGRIRR